MLTRRALITGTLALLLAPEDLVPARRYWPGFGAGFLRRAGPRPTRSHFIIDPKFFVPSSAVRNDFLEYVVHQPRIRVSINDAIKAHLLYGHPIIPLGPGP